jgi:ACR3 family arsenite transporter
VPFISPITLIALLFTIVIMFSLKGELIVQIPMDVFESQFLVIYFTLMFVLSFMVGSTLVPILKYRYCLYSDGNNFELAIAVAIGVWNQQRTSFCRSYRPSRSSGIDSLSECRFWFRKNYPAAAKNLNHPTI